MFFQTSQSYKKNSEPIYNTYWGVTKKLKNRLDSGGLTTGAKNLKTVTAYLNFSQRHWKYFMAN